MIFRNTNRRWQRRIIFTTRVAGRIRIRAGRIRTSVGQIRHAGAAIVRAGQNLVIRRRRYQVGLQIQRILNDKPFASSQQARCTIEDTGV